MMYQVIFTYNHSANIKRSEYFRATDGQEVSSKILDWKNRLKQRDIFVTVETVKRVR